MDSVDLHSAYVWKCPNCNAANIERPVPVEVSEEDRREDPEVFAKAETGDWVVGPDEVKCHQCEREYNAINPHDEPPEEFGDED